MADDSEAKVRVTADTSDEEAGMKRASEALEGLNNKVKSLVDGFNMVKEAVVFGEIGDKVIELIHQVAELGEQTEDTAAILGITTERVGQIAYAASMAGQTLEGTSLAMERLANNMERARGGSANEIDAFNRLGVQLTDSQGKLKSMDEMLLETADAFSKHADGPEKAALAIQLFGRAGAQMIPLLDQGRQHMLDLMQQAKETGTVLDEDTTKRLSDLQHSLTTLGMSFQGLGIAIVNTFQPEIKALTDAFSSMVQWMTHGTTESYQSGGALHYLAEAFAGVVAAIDFLMMAFKALWEMASAILDSLGESVVALGEDMYYALTGQWGKIAPAAKDAADKIKAAWVQAFADIGKAEDDFAKRQNKLWSEVLNPPASVNLAGDEKGGLPAFADPTNQAKAKAALDEIKKELNQINSMFDSLFQSIIKGLDTAISGLVTGTMTWQQALGSAFNSVYQAFVQMAEQMLAKWLASEATMLVAHLTGNEAMAASDTATSTQGAITMLLAALKSIGTSSAVTAAGVTANLAPVMGPLAIPAGDAAGAEVMAFASGLSAFDVGSWNIDRDQIAQVHQGEMIVPAYNGMADMMRNLMGGNAGGMGGSPDEIADAIAARLGPSMRGQQYAQMNTQRTLHEMLRRARG